MQHIESERNIGEVLKEVGVDRLAGAGLASTGQIAPARKASDYLKSMVGWVYACVSAIADEIGMIELHLYKQKGEKAVEIENHPAIDLLYKPNDFTTRFDLFATMAQYLELTGEAPFYVSVVGGKPSQLLILRPDKLTVKQGTNGNVINGYEYEVEKGKRVNLETEEVVFVRYPDPNKPFRGLGTLQAVAKTVDIDEYSEDYNKSFFFNSARPDGAVETDLKLNDTQLQKLTRKFEDKYKGKDNSHKTIILHSGLKYKPISITQKDMDFMEQQKFSRDKILGIFRVPRTVLGITDDVNRANAEATDYVFAKRTIKPKIERIVQQLNEFYLPLFKGTEGMYFDYKSPVPEDGNAKRENNKAGLQYGYVTVNEVRESEGLSPLGEEADKLRLPIGFNEIETYDENGVSGDTTQLSIPVERRNQIARRVRKAQRVEIIREKIEETLKKTIMTQKGVDEAVEKPEEKVEERRKIDQKWLDFQNKQLEIADQYIPKFKGSFDTIFDEQTAEVIAKLDKKELNPKDFLLSPAKEKKRYVKYLAGLFSSMIIEQSKEAFSSIGVDDEFSSTNPAVSRYLDKRAFKFSTPVTQETNRRLANELKEGINGGEGIPDLKKRVEGIFGDMKANRSEVIARSETIRATNYATQETYIQSGVVEGKEWLATQDDTTCEFCGKMDGRVVDVEGEYLDKGTVFVGRDGGKLPIDYETVEHPPLHPQCRCTLIPVISKSAVVPEKKEESDIKEKKIMEKLDSILSDISNDGTK